MRIALLACALAAAGGLASAQEPQSKPVPKDSVRVFIPGCAKGLVFTVGPRTVDEPGRSDIPPGMHLRLAGNKKLLADIRAHSATMLEITGLIRKGQLDPGGLRLGGNVRIGPAPSAMDPNSGRGVNPGQVIIDVEGWRAIAGDCPVR